MITADRLNIETDVRSIPRLRLLRKLENDYTVEAQETETLTTPSGKTLRLRGRILYGTSVYYTVYIFKLSE